MYEAEMLSMFSKMPIFTLSDMNQIIDNREYTKRFIKRMVKDNKIFKIKKNLYTVHEDPFLVSTFLVKPSYVSSVSALAYHRLITQIPNEVFCATTKKAIRFDFLKRINIFHTNHFFGFKPEDYNGFRVLIAEPEKAIIDSFSILPISLFQEAFDDVDKKKLVEYVKRIKKSSIAKRIGYLLGKDGYDAYKELKQFINYKYIALDPLLRYSGKKDRKWRLIVNVR